MCFSVHYCVTVIAFQKSAVRCSIVAVFCKMVLHFRAVFFFYKCCYEAALIVFLLWCTNVPVIVHCVVLWWCIVWWTDMCFCDDALMWFYDGAMCVSVIVHWCGSMMVTDVWFCNGAMWCASMNNHMLGCTVCECWDLDGSIQLILLLRVDRGEYLLQLLHWCLDYVCCLVYFIRVILLASGTWSIMLSVFVSLLLFCLYLQYWTCSSVCCYVSSTCTCGCTTCDWVKLQQHACFQGSADLGVQLMSICPGCHSNTKL